jgi:hypothetical protein
VAGLVDFCYIGGMLMPDDDPEDPWSWLDVVNAFLVDPDDDDDEATQWDEMTDWDLDGDDLDDDEDA